MLSIWSSLVVVADQQIEVLAVVAQEVIALTTHLPGQPQRLNFLVAEVLLNLRLLQHWERLIQSQLAREEQEESTQVLMMRLLDLILNLVQL
jgi:hypothetical protein